MIGLSLPAHSPNLLFFAGLIALCNRKPVTCIVVGASTLIGVLCAPSAPQAVPSSGAIALDGTVVSPPTLGPKGASAVVDAGRHRYDIVFLGHDEVALGQRVHVYGRLLPLRGSFGRSLLNEGVSATVLCRYNDLEILDHGPFWFETGNRLRNSFLTSVGGSLSGREAALIDAMCVAAGSRLDKSTHEGIVRSGVAHIVSASGLQVYLLAAAVQVILSLFPIKRGVQLGVVFCVLAAYLSATGFHAATLRACIVTVVALSAYFFRREPDYLSATGLAAIVTLLWQPWSLYSPGFQLTYVAVAALSLYWKRFPSLRNKEKWQIFLRWLWLLFRVSLIATLATAPITAFHFGEVSLIAPFTNLLIDPVVPILLLIAMIFWPIGLLLPNLHAAVLNLVAAPLAGWILFVTDAFGGLPWTFIQLPEFSAYWLILYYSVFLLIKPSGIRA
jgi:competence protein ComEC